MLNKRKKTFIIIMSILCIIVVLFGVIKVQNRMLKKFYPQKYAEYVVPFAEQNQVDPLWIFAIIKAESNFERNVVSSSGAIGLMQLMESTANEIANDLEIDLPVKEALYHPETNIKIGTYYFAYLLDTYEGNTLLALTAYNAGMGNVNKWIEEGIIQADGSDIENIPYKETNQYVRKIIRNYKIYQDLYGGGK